MHEILVFDVSLPESLHDWCLTTNHEVIQKNGSSVTEPNTVKEVTVYSMCEWMKTNFKKGKWSFCL